MLFKTKRNLFSYNAFALQGAKSARADFDADFFTVNDKRLFLDISIPSLAGAALRKADIVAKLLAFTGDFTLFHTLIPKNFVDLHSTTFYFFGQGVHKEFCAR